MPEGAAFTTAPRRVRGVVDRGANFQEQWKRALALDPPFVMVTGWNEWIAGRWGKPGGPIEFVDQFDQEFSRDIEPMMGGHADNYYYQLVANVRRFKGTAPLPAASATRSIAIDGGFDQWRDVTPELSDDSGDTLRRDHDGSGGTHYVNRTGRNDLVAFKVAHDSSNLSFYARTRQPLSPPTDANWMWLLIDADRDTSTGWQGYDFIVNRSIEQDGTTWLEKNDGGWAWTRLAKIRYRCAGNELHISVPVSSLNVRPGEPAISVDFKWVDNAQRPGDIMDFYVSGDVAPEGRFRFRYNAVTGRARP